jgi:hypothetical protein
LAANEFWFFPELKPSLTSPKLKSASKGRRFQYIEDIKEHVTMALKVVPQQEFQKCFQQWQHHWAKYIAAQGEYFEGDPSQ